MEWKECRNFLRKTDTTIHIRNNNCTENERQNGFAIALINAVRCFAQFVGSIEQSSVVGTRKKYLSEMATTRPKGEVKTVVAILVRRGNFGSRVHQ